MPLRSEQVVVSACRYGRLMHLVNDAYLGRGLALYGEYSEGEVQLFRLTVQPGMLALDIGANIGAHTVALASIVGNRGAVMAFEPVPLFFQMLSGNVALNALMNVRTFPYAVGAEHGSVRIPAIDFGQDDNYGGFELDQFTSGEPVPVVTIDELSLPRVGFMKIDVEGYEERVLRGAEGTIHHDRPVLYVECNPGPRAPELLRYVQEIGYDPYWHLPPLFNPDNWKGTAENVYLNIVSWNLLCVPHGFPVRGLERADPDHIPVPASYDRGSFPPGVHAGTADPDPDLYGVSENRSAEAPDGG